MTKLQEKKYIAIVFLVLMCVQFMPIEGHGVSNVKFAAMCLSPFIWLNSFKTFSKAFVWGGIYLLATLFSIIYNSDSFRLSTVGYKMALVMLFLMYYDLIYYNKALTLQDFIKFLRALILAFVVCLLLQQIAIIVGLRFLPIINLISFLDRGIGSNSLSLEPSHAARILTVLMLVLIRMYEIMWTNSTLMLSSLYKENKWVIIGFLWAMLSMGSGTAFVGLAILSLYFMKQEYIIVVSAVFLIFYLSIPLINFMPLNRAKAAIEVSFTLDQKKIIEEDGSAAARIVPLLNTFTNLDLKKAETWIGKGVDANVSAKYLSKDQTIGGISDYGLICFILSLIFLFVCCIKKPLSIETLIFTFMFGLTIGNFAYTWGALMLLATSKYFTTNKRLHYQIKKIEISN